tara:strand:- start:63317 stop:64183 length:867 start_codon:yes stop_codon:yes gene_type:complete
MGTTKAALALCLLMLGFASPVRADPCTARTSNDSPFAICFDVGNRLYLEAGTDGIGGSVRLRHTIGFDDEPDLVWKLDHRLLQTSAGGMNDAYSGVVYEGRYVRHARDGHIVLPLGTPRKFFVPFDIGAQAEVGRFRQRKTIGPLELRVVQITGLLDFSRTDSFQRRFTVGVVAHWDLQLDREEMRISENLVAPLSMLGASFYMESDNGLSLVEAEISGGREWSSINGWQWAGAASVTVERILIAINDRPLSIMLETRAKTSEQHMETDLTALAGARFSLFSAKRASF